MIYCTDKKRLLIIISLVVVCVMCCLIVCNETFATVYTNNSTRKIPVYSVDCEEKKVALTFDAAWGADKTLKILEILQKYQVKATFFLVGFWVEKYPEETKAIAQSGCEIGNHSANHLQMSKLSESKVIEELQSVNNQIESLTGEKCKFFRAPFGDYNNTLIERAESLGMQTIQWSIDSLDWKGLSSVEIVQRVNNNIKNGSIILFHNNSENIVEALPLVLANIINKGYEPVLLSQLVFENDYTIDGAGVQHKNQ